MGMGKQLGKGAIFTKPTSVLVIQPHKADGLRNAQAWMETAGEQQDPYVLVSLVPAGSVSDGSAPGSASWATMMGDAAGAGGAAAATAGGVRTRDVIDDPGPMNSASI